MKNFKKLSICLMLVLFGMSATNAQSTVRSGSFQFINDTYKRVGTLVLQSGGQEFEFPISENIVVANLLPGRYLLTIKYQSGSKGGQMTKTSSSFDIWSEKRTVCRMNANADVRFYEEYDRNSMQILTGNFRDDRHDFDRRDDHKIAIVQPPMPQPVPDFEFNKLYNAIQNENFSDTKMRMLRTSSNFYEYFSSDQVKRLAALFTSDADKLECVKYLVPKVLDIQNLPYIQDVFTFKSTKDDYLRFLNRR